MSREIKFRGLKSHNNEWVYGSLAYFFNSKENSCIMPDCYYGTRDFGEEDKKGNTIISNEIALGGFIDVLPKSVGQFTGLKDKNGVDIYEGDIVKKTFWYFGTNTKKPTESIGQVKWNNESASFLFYVGYYLGLTADNIELEIIGNINENPELLNKEVVNA